MQEEKYVAFRLGKEEYAFPIGLVREIIVYMSATKIPESPEYMEGIINLRGKVIPVVNLGSRFSLRQGDKRGYAIILDVEGTDVAVTVDEVTEVVMIGADQIEPPPEAMAGEFIMGIGKLQNRLLILLHVANLLADTKAALPVSA